MTSENSAPLPASDEPLLDASAPQILAEAWRDKQTGHLQIQQGNNHRVIHILDGSPVGVDARDIDESFAQRLLNSGILDESDHRKVKDFAKDRNCPEANAVLALGLLEAKELYRALRDVTRSQICEVFSWTHPSHRWTPVDPADKPKGKPFDILKLIQEQLTTQWGIERLFTALLPRSEDILELTPSFRRVSNQLGTTGPSAQKVLDQLSGSKSIGQVLGESAGDPLAAATVWVLVTAGLVRSRKTQSNPGVDAYDFQVVVTGASDPTHEDPTTGSSATTADAGTGGAASAPNPKAEALRTEICEILTRLGNLTHYEALDIDVDASPAAIKKAYFKSAKKYHPDSLAQLDLTDLRDEAAQVFGRIAEAFEILSDESKRTAYDSGDSDHSEIDTARLTQAETSFRKGEILVKMGNFMGALEYLEPAVELWAEEPAYQAELAWALLKQPRSNPARAREHFEIAHRQEPNNARTLYRLGLVLRSLGEQELSEDFILRARAIDPDVQD